eukprot:24321-Pyramimonas_sp.AAC.1
MAGRNMADVTWLTKHDVSTRGTNQTQEAQACSHNGPIAGAAQALLESARIAQQEERHLSPEAAAELDGERPSPPPGDPSAPLRTPPRTPPRTPSSPIWRPPAGQLELEPRS